MMSTEQGPPPAARRLRPPGLGLMLAEVRGIFEFNTSVLLSPLLMRAPRGDGHPVLTLPGFLASDLSMAPMRRYLKELGYDAYAWQMGRNTGGVTRMRAALRDRLAQIHAATGRKVSLVGGGLGGVYAHDLALQDPDMVRYVVTLGSPFAGDVRATNATRLYEVRSGEAVQQDSELRKRSQAICRCRPRRSIRAPTASSIGEPACFAPPIRPKISRCTWPVMSGWV